MAGLSSRLIVVCGFVLCLSARDGFSEAALPVGQTPAPVMFSHFPDRMHAVVWRNWHAVAPARIADVLDTSAGNVTAVAETMGLPPAVPIPPEQNSPGHFHMTLLRRNWHLLPCEQLAALLNVSPEELVAFVRGEDIANWSILGGFKPACEPVRYAPPDPVARRRAAAIKQLVRQHFGEEIGKRGEPRFAFIRRLSQVQGLRPVDNRRQMPLFAPRYVCSCFQVLGDPLMDPELGVYPEGLLERLAEVGVDGVWLYGELAKLAPGGERISRIRRRITRHGWRTCAGSWRGVNGSASACTCTLTSPARCPSRFSKTGPKWPVSAAGITICDVYV